MQVFCVNWKKKKKKGLHFHAGALSTDKQKCVCVCVCVEGGGGGQASQYNLLEKISSINDILSLSNVYSYHPLTLFLY